MTRRYLQHIYVQRYGALADCEVGPLEPGMNVVLGPNEAGKSTVSSLVGGVLFGWEDAHGVRNTYRPPTGGRAGRLQWEAPPGELSRDEDGATGDASVTADIDRATYDTLFALTADELRSLRGSSDVTARLLAAGSGTSASPSAAFVEVERRLVEATSDVLSLASQLDAKRVQVKQASEQAELLLQQDRELRALTASRAATAERIEAMNAEVEDLVARRAELETIDERTARRTAELEELRSELAELAELAPPAPPAPAPAQAPAPVPATTGPISAKLDPRLLQLDSADDRVLRDRLDEFAEQREKLERVADLAKENAATSTAAYEALMELSEEDVAASRSLRNRPSQAVVSVLLPVAFIAAGLPLFLHGRAITSLSISALGIGLVVIAVFLAAAAFYVLFRPPREAGVLEQRRQDAQWVMLQDRKKRDASQQELAEFEDKLARYLDEAGLAAADGSVRQARTLLDEAASRRAEIAANDQRVSSLELRIRAAEKELAELAAARARIAEAVELPPTATPDTLAARDLEALVRSRAAARDALLEAAEDMSRRFGELSRDLAAARDDRTFDLLKLEARQLKTRLRDRKHELMELLLAKRMLDRSIIAWESQSQPEVYARAGRLLATITGGRWVEVATSPSGSLVAVASDGTVRDPRHLSLGTCQQLYLALRIALLETADDVGRAIPVLADDILVNFDPARRAGAAAALAELAQHRQVIVFTCHRETLAALQAHGASVIPLS